MATTRTKEEQQLLDEKIARIQKKNEEILRRQKEIEEDKRLAEQQNALVKLRPSTVNTSRERTPALKPSKRELREDFTDNAEFQEPVVERVSRGSFRTRGGERYRGQGDWKRTGPPPDPKSFLYDDERDGPSRDRDGKNDMKRDFDRKRNDEQGNRDDNRGGREFQRGGWRGGVEHRSERGRRGGGRGGRSGRNDEEAWRAERMRIDEARIQRQKSADGKWRREWDNEKITQEDIEDPRYESRRTTSISQEQWHPPHDHHQHHHHHHQHPHQCQMHGSPHGGHHHHSPHDCPHHPQPVPSKNRGRGRGRLDPSELEMPLENIRMEVIQQKVSPWASSDRGSVLVENTTRHQKTVDSSPCNISPNHQDDFNFGENRSIECVGNSVKISIPNTNVGQSPPKAQRKVNESRGRYKSQASYSSQSDEDTPRDKGQRGGRRQRNPKYSRDQEKSSFQPKTINRDKGSQNTSAKTVPDKYKPPLPPVKSSQIPLTSCEDKDGDDSWEDMTTSGAESMGEELSSVHSSPGKSIPNMVIVNSATHDESVAEDILIADITPSDYNFDEYLNQIGVPSSSTSLTNEVNDSSLLDSQVIGIQPLNIDSETQNNGSDQNVNQIDIKSLVDMKEIEIILEEFSISAATVPDNQEIVSKGVKNTLNEDVFESDCLVKLNPEQEKLGDSIEENSINNVENTPSEKVVKLDCLKKSQTEENKIVETNLLNLDPENVRSEESDCLVKLNPEQEKLGDSIEENLINKVDDTPSEKVVELDCIQKSQTEENKIVETNLLNLEPENVKSEENIVEEGIKNHAVENKNEQVSKDSNSLTLSENSTKISETQKLVSEDTCINNNLTSCDKD